MKNFDFSLCATSGLTIVDIRPKADKKAYICRLAVSEWSLEAFQRVEL